MPHCCYGPTVLTNDAATMRQMLMDYYQSRRARNTDLCITEVGPADSDQSSTSLVGGLFYADNSGQALLSGFQRTALVEFSQRRRRGRRQHQHLRLAQFQDYGMVSGSGSARFKPVSGFLLLQADPIFRARRGIGFAGDQQFTIAWPLTRSSRRTVRWRLLVINKSSTVNIIGNFTSARLHGRFERHRLQLRHSAG